MATAWLAPPGRALCTPPPTSHTRSARSLATSVPNEKGSCSRSEKAAEAHCPRPSLRPSGMPSGKGVCEHGPRVLRGSGDRVGESSFFRGRLIAGSNLFFPRENIACLPYILHKAVRSKCFPHQNCPQENAPRGPPFGAVSRRLRAAGGPSFLKKM